MENIYEFIITLINSAGTYGTIANCVFIIIESIIPPLPLALFITVLFVNYGPLIGFIISWIFTIIGCILSFCLFQTLFKSIVDKHIRKNKLCNKFIALFDNINFSTLVLVISIPFTPAFLVNIAAGISKMDLKKFIPAIVIGKISLVLFWGFVGSSLIESLKNPLILIKVVLIVGITYIISKLINKKLKID